VVADSARWIIDLLVNPATPLYGMLLIVGVMAWRAAVAGFPGIISSLLQWRDSSTKTRRTEIERLEARCERLEDRDDECRRELTEVRDTLADEQAARKRLEAIMLGIGEGKQMVQAGLSADRAEERATADKRAEDK
jgi:hypothetical protein